MKKSILSLLIVGLVFASCKKEEPMGSVTLDPATKTVHYDQPYQIKPVFSVDGQASKKTYSWKTSADSIVTVQAALAGGLGDVKPRRIGTATITYASMDGKVVATSEVTVSPRSNILDALYYKKQAAVSDIKNNVNSREFTFDEAASDENFLVYSGGNIIAKLIYEMKSSKLEALWIIVSDNTDNRSAVEHYIKERFVDTGRVQEGITYFLNTGVPDAFPINTGLGVFLDKNVHGNDYSYGVKVTTIQ